MAHLYFQDLSPLYQATVKFATKKALDAVKVKLRTGTLVAAIHIPMKLTKQFRDQQKHELLQKAQENKEFVLALRKDCVGRIQRRRHRQDALLSKLMHKIEAQAMQRPAVDELLRAQRQAKFAEIKAKAQKRREDLRLLREASQPSVVSIHKRVLPRLAAEYKQTEVAEGLAQSYKVTPLRAHALLKPAQYSSTPMQKNYSLVIKPKHPVEDFKKRSVSPEAVKGHIAFVSRGNRNNRVEQKFGAAFVYDNSVLTAVRRRLAELNTLK